MDPSKKQIVERLKQATNILVTVSANPTVDQLASCIGITLFLNKLGKHATAVFSGEAPSTIEFLQPEATLEKNTNSLRDFIIALDKSKADKLRYKVEENVVKIFITPYRTSLSQEDLNFSQGDFNVEAVLALGVAEREDLDKAIVAHGRILHDATVMSVSTGSSGGLGSINWSDPSSSSLCEMLTSLLDELKKDQLDNQIATALLTGIVAQTDRFSNEKTSPQTMSQASILMAAGANQQLIATKLQEPLATPTVTQDTIPVAQEDAAPSQDVVAEDGTLSINHYEEEHSEDDSTKDEQEPLDYSIHDAPEDNESDLPDIHIDDGGNFRSLEEDGNFENNVSENDASADYDQDKQNDEGDRPDMIFEPPSMGGALNASEVISHNDDENTADPLSSPAQLESILQHGGTGSPAMQYEPTLVPENNSPAPVSEDLPNLTSILPSSSSADDEPLTAPSLPEQESNIEPTPQPLQPSEPTDQPTLQSPEPLLQPYVDTVQPEQSVVTDQQPAAPQHLDDARSAVENALNSGDNLEPVQGLGTSPLSNGSLHEDAVPIGDILAQTEQQPSNEPIGEVIDPTQAPDAPPPLLPPLPPIQPDSLAPPTNPLFNQPN